MAKKILTTLTNNIGFKLLAIFFAFVLWLVVYNIDDPTKTATFTASVVLQNTQSITEMDKCYEVIDGTGTVSFRVTAKRSVLDKMADSDFVAVADMSQLQMNEDQTQGTVEVNISARTNASQIRFASLAKYLKVSLEDLQTKQFVITANTTGSVTDGYALGDVSVTNPNVIKVSGPASVVSQISSVVAVIDVEGMSTDISDNVVPQFYDEDGKSVDTTKLTLSNDTVTITAKILSTKEVTLNFITSGEPAASYSVTGILSDPETVKVKGSSTILNPIASIDIPEDVLNVQGATSSITTTVDITEYLPDGVSLVDKTEANVTVTVSIEAYSTENFSMPSSNITVDGLDSANNLAFAQSAVAVAISGMDSDLALINAASLKGTINVSGLSTGTHTVRVTVDLDGSIYSVGTVTVDVSITEKSTGTTGDTTDGSTGGTTGDTTGGSTGGSSGGSTEDGEDDAN